MTDAAHATTAVDQRRAEFTAGLRAVADWYDAHPNLPLPIGPRIGVQITTHAQDCADEEVPDRFATAARALGGDRKKVGDDKFFTVERWFGPIAVEVYGYRESVCEARVVGTRQVERPITEVVGTETVTEDIVEWECRPILATDGAA